MLLRLKTHRKARCNVWFRFLTNRNIPVVASPSSFPRVPPVAIWRSSQKAPVLKVREKLNMFTKFPVHNNSTGTGFFFPLDASVKVLLCYFY